MRLGGIYALERIAKESPEDYGPVIEILTAYVREHAPLNSEKEMQPPTPDIQAILTVLGRRTYNSTREDTARIDLHSTDLPHANLQGADLRGARLQQTNLLQANLQGADLQVAFL